MALLDSYCAYIVECRVIGWSGRLTKSGGAGDGRDVAGALLLPIERARRRVGHRSLLG